MSRFAALSLSVLAPALALPCEFASAGAFGLALPTLALALPSARFSLLTDALGVVALTPVSAFTDESSANALNEIAAIPQKTTGRNFRMYISPFMGE